MIRSLHSLHRHHGLRFSRTAGDAFKDATYASAIELPPPSFWQRVWSLLWR